MKHESKGGSARIYIGIAAGVLALVLALFALWHFVLRDSDLFGDSDPDAQMGGEVTPGQPDSGKDPAQQTGGSTNNPPAPGYDPDKSVEVPTPSMDAAKLEGIRAEAARLAATYDYESAIALLNDYDVAEFDGLKKVYQQQLDELVPYTGRYYHVFFHSLVADTSKAFDGDGDSNGYNMFMTTVSEFNEMLPLLQEDGFILVRINDLCWFDEDGNVHENTLLLPKGKKPLVLSIDDVNYYEYMQDDGFAVRLDVDENGRVVTVMKDDAGKEYATYDGDVMPILDTYVDQHPEFSYKGAKGIVACTGYAGAFGYRITDLELFTPEQGKYMLGKVTEVANALRSTGWEIASHSYTHNQYWNKKTITREQLEYDTGRWVNEIMPYVGKTNIFISPFGVMFPQDSDTFQYLVSQGFNIYCPVGSDMTTTFKGNAMVQARLNLDGITMINYPERISRHFFDPTPLIDPARPKTIR